MIVMQIIYCVCLKWKYNYVRIKSKNLSNNLKGWHFMEEIREQLLRKIPNNVDGSIYISYEESEKSQREIEKLKNEKWVDYIKSFGKGKIEVFVLNQYLNNEKFEQDKTEVIKKITKKLKMDTKEIKFLIQILELWEIIELRYAIIW